MGMRNPNPPLRHALWVRMRDRATLDRLPAGHALRKRADSMEAAFEAMEAQMHDSIFRFIRAWDMARSTWERYTGEKLI